MEKTITVKVNADTTELDKALEKVSQVAQLNDREKAKALLLDTIETACDQSEISGTAPKHVIDIAEAVRIYCIL